MLFNTYQFAYFFVLLFPAYWLLRRWARLQNILLLGAGYYFYACWNPKFLLLLVLSTAMDYACGLWVDRADEPGEVGEAEAAGQLVQLLGMRQPRTARPPHHDDLEPIAKLGP